MDGVEDCEALEKGVVRPTGGSHRAITSFPASTTTRQASLFVDLEKEVKWKEALIPILD